MHYVYILESDASAGQQYIGYSRNLKQRIEDHNLGHSPHTAKYRPWNLVFYAAFAKKFKALEFESYLKSHSGKAFAAKRLL
ncbi:MAG: GIY-YIG nuclease family protein [Verrucomicrobia bacterium]|jgi:predicted GIY-YIG superfamily endonuclease|nr:GIY-YIG nuclease family protein [Verrucomicrobiota bacterium]